MVSAAHLDCHGGPVVQLRPVHLRQAGGGDGLVVKRFEKLPGALVEVFLEERLHLAAEIKRGSGEKSFTPCSGWVSVSLRVSAWSHLAVPPVQGLVLQDLQGADVLRGQQVVEGAQALAQLDVYAAVPQRALHDVVCRPLVAGRHLAGVGLAALTAGRAAVSGGRQRVSHSGLERLRILVVKVLIWLLYSSKSKKY